MASSEIYSVELNRPQKLGLIVSITKMFNLEEYNVKKIGIKSVGKSPAERGCERLKPNGFRLPVLVYAEY